MLEVEPERLVLTHFGSVEGREAADSHLNDVLSRNRHWSQHILEGLKAGESDEVLVERMQRLEDAELATADVLPGIRQRYKVTSDASMTVMGVKRYFTKRGEV